jgi:hypothetical protein
MLPNTIEVNRYPCQKKHMTLNRLAVTTPKMQELDQRVPSASRVQVARPIDVDTFIAW